MTIARPRRLLARVSAPATEPLTLAEAKLYLRVDGSAEDALIADLIAAAREYAEEYLSHSLITQSWKLAFNDCLPHPVALPRGPVVSVTSVIAYDKADSPTALDPSAYRVNAARDALMLDVSVRAYRIEIIYVAGYGSASSVPVPLKQGMLSHIAAMFHRRGEGGELPAEAAALYAPYREVRL